MIEQLCEYAEIHWNYMGELHDMCIMAYWRINKNLLGVNEWQIDRDWHLVCSQEVGAGYCPVITPITHDSFKEL